jgi:hypothetical protein
VVADVIIIAYFVLTTVFSFTKALICNLIMLVLVVGALVLGLAVHQYGTAAVAQWVLNHGVEWGKQAVGKVFSGKAEM